MIFDLILGSDHGKKDAFWCDAGDRRAALLSGERLSAIIFHRIRIGVNCK
jgi:hypothetical protein